MAVQICPGAHGSMEGLAKRIIFIGISAVSAVAVSEIILRLFFNTPPISQEWLLYSEDKSVSASYIFEKPELRSLLSGVPGNVVFIGDSYTERGLWQHLGITSYPELVAASVSARLINFGLGAAGPDQEFRYFVENILPNNPRFVVWQLHANDIRDAVSQEVYGFGDADALVARDASSHWLVRRQMFYRALPFPDIAMRSRLIRAVLRAFETGATLTLPREILRDPDAYGVRKIERLISEMNRLSREHGFSVLYLQIVPQAKYLESGADGRLRDIADLYVRLDNLLSKQKNYIRADVLHGSTGAIATGPAFPVDRMFLGEEDGNPVGDRHLTQAGHDAVAANVIPVLRSFLQEAGHAL